MSTLSAVTTKIITLDRDSPVPLFRQIYYCLRDGILAGELVAGMQLPSTRLLALDLSVSRLTVQNAYEQLIAEGYATGRHGSGTYVAVPPPVQPQPGQVLTAQRRPPTAATRRLAQRVAGLLQLAPLTSPSAGDPKDDFAFRLDLPALDTFPRQLWGRLLGRRWRNSSSQLLGDQAHGGHAALRSELAVYLTTERGIRCNADQIIIVADAQQAIDLAARVLLDPGDKVWIEDPGHPGARGAFVAAGAGLCPVPVDMEGINVAAGMVEYVDARLVFVTPAHQWPTGVTMSLPRRLMLLEWAYRAGAWIIEDDNGGVFPFGEHAIAPLYALDQQQRVVHIGSFGKMLFPTLRLGYLIAPDDLLDPLRQVQQVATVEPPLLEQVVLADFLAGGHFAHHLRQQRILFAERQTALVAVCRQEFGDWLEISPTRGGTHLVGWLPTGTDDRQAAVQAAAAGINVLPLSVHRSRTEPRRGLAFGYGATPPNVIVHGVKRLAQLLAP
jgi:GntR family transcriptional regulator / MocR family aminotransferase